MQDGNRHRSRSQPVTGETSPNGPSARVMTGGRKALVSSPPHAAIPELAHLWDRGAWPCWRFPYQAGYKPNPVRAPAAPAPTTTVAPLSAPASAGAHRLIDKCLEPFTGPPVCRPSPDRMGPARQRARDLLPVRGGWRACSADGRV